MRNISKIISVFILAGCLFLLPRPDLYSQAGDNGAGVDPLVIKIAVIGPGDDVYLWWGHIGLIIENYATGRARFYDWGVFSFDNENFYLNFAFGRLLYTCSVSSPEWNLEEFAYENRDAVVYTLNLSAKDKERIREYAEWTILPENKDYYYHHFDDNCATRVRDIIDMATNGQFSALYENTPGRLTLREHVRRHTWFNPFFDWFLSFLMGQGIDVPINVWTEMFLPSEIGLRVQEFTYRDSDGNNQKLLQSAEIKSRSVGRPAVLDVPRPLWPRTLVLSCIIAVFFGILLYLKTREKPAANFIWAIGQGVLGLFFGIAGTVLFFMTFFTNHDYTYRNINVLFVNPLLLAAVPLAVIYCKNLFTYNYHKPEIYIKTLWSCVLGLGVLGILINALFLGQQNQADIALVLPFAAVLSWLPDCLGYIRREYLWRWLN